MNHEPLLNRGYRPLELDAKAAIAAALAAAPPATSELTFTNLFIWRHHYRPIWRELEGRLLLIMAPHGQEPFGLPPLGAGDLTPAALALLDDLAAVGVAPRLGRVGAEAWARMDQTRFAARADRDQSDYVYAAQDLIQLRGNRFHRKKNHLNKFLKSQPHQYRPLDADLVRAVLEMQDAWCALRRPHGHSGEEAATGSVPRAHARGYPCAAPCGLYGNDAFPPFAHRSAVLPRRTGRQ